MSTEIETKEKAASVGAELETMIREMGIEWVISVLQDYFELRGDALPESLQAFKRCVDGYDGALA